MVPYRNSSLDRWQKKTQLSVGGAASKLRLRSLNQVMQSLTPPSKDMLLSVVLNVCLRLSVDVMQSITEQVAAIMRDPSRIMNRARGRSSSIHVLGQVKARCWCLSICARYVEQP